MANRSWWMRRPAPCPSNLTLVVSPRRSSSGRLDGVGSCWPLDVSSLWAATSALTILLRWRTSFRNHLMTCQKHNGLDSTLSTRSQIWSCHSSEAFSLIKSASGKSLSASPPLFPLERTLMSLITLFICRLGLILFTVVLTIGQLIFAIGGY